MPSVNVALFLKYVCLLDSQQTQKHNYMPKLLGQGSNFHEHRHLLSQMKDGTPLARASRACARARTHARTPHRQNM